MPETLGITGSGAIACGLARAAANSHEVLLWARSEASADRACAKVEDAARVITELSELSACSLVVEAIAEDPAAKRDLYGRLAEVLFDETVLATTTSSLSVSELAAASGRPDRFAALHVFNPVHKMALVELSFPDAASEDTRARMRDLCQRLGKTAVEVPDSAGFVVNKLLFPYLFDAVRLLERNGLGPESIDTCMQLGAGHPMGPLALLDFVGLDVAASIGDSIGADVPERLRELIAEGRLGRKSGRGFYEY
jgi:3-hydroxyacyl-CoA dehydrogenase